MTGNALCSVHYNNTSTVLWLGNSYVCEHDVYVESACLSELNEDRLCIALLDRLLCVV